MWKLKDSILAWSEGFNTFGVKFQIRFVFCRIFVIYGLFTIPALEPLNLGSFCATWVVWNPSYLTKNGISMRFRSTDLTVPGFRNTPDTGKTTRHPSPDTETFKKDRIPHVNGTFCGKIKISVRTSVCLRQVTSNICGSQDQISPILTEWSLRSKAKREGLAYIFFRKKI